MPKHTPSFKHLLSTATEPHPTSTSAKREKSVNELLASSRASSSSLGAAHRDLPPHVIGDNVKIWVPGVMALSDGASSSGGDMILGDTGVHPSNLAQRQASRSVAGPAPPPSWRSRPSPIAGPSNDIHNAAANGSPTTSDTLVSTSQLNEAMELFHHPLIAADATVQSSLNERYAHSSERGSASLTVYCLKTVLAYLDNDEEVEYQYRNEASETEMTDPKDGAPGSTVGSIFREQVSYLDIHLKSRLMSIASVQPESSELRLSDRSLQAILSAPGRSPSLSDDWPEWSDHGGGSGTGSASNDIVEEDENSWENAGLAPGRAQTIHHLPLTLHPAPHHFLRSISQFTCLSLTSLNLAYSTIPYDLDKLISVLPSGLRELSLRGVRIGNELKGRVPTDRAITMTSEARADWSIRLIGSLTKLGRKFLVLKMLDLSLFPIRLSGVHLTSLLQPSSSRLPSLRVLGLEGILDRPSTNVEYPQVAEDPVEGKRRLGEIVRRDRSRWVEVIWD